MGWMNPTEQQEVLALFGKQAEYRCDYSECLQPIFIDQLPECDPKGGFYPKDKDAPSFIGNSRYKKTYHRVCWRVMKGLAPKQIPKMGSDAEPRVKGEERRVAQDRRKEKSALEPKKKEKKKADNGYVPKALQTIEGEILALIRAKPKKEYWTISKCIRALKHKEKKPDLRKALKHLRKTGELRREGGFLYLTKGGKK